jgi:hypothetical protein
MRVCDLCKTELKHNRNAVYWGGIRGLPEDTCEDCRNELVEAMKRVCEAIKRRYEEGKS